MGYFLEVKNISKHFGGIQALHDVSVNINKGEVLCLVGENGAGKSTLAKVFVGINAVDEGTLFINGEEVKKMTPVLAREKRLCMVAQELNLMKHLSIAENIFMMEKDSYKYGIYQNKEAIVKTKKLFDNFNLTTFPHPTTKLSELTIGQQQIVEIMKAVAQENDLIVFDEPTTALSLNEVDSLFKVIRRLKSEGLAIVLVTHKFNEVFELSDYVTVLCDGRLVKERIPIGELDQFKLVKLMVGRDIKDFFGQKIPREIGETVLKVEGLSDENRFNDVSFELKKQEILGFGGLVGAGRTEIMEAIFGVRKFKKGKIYLNGKDITHISTKSKIKNGLALVTEDRKQKGLCLGLSIFSNMTLININLFKSPFVYEKIFEKDVNNAVKQLSIKLDTLNELASSLSGGNQQKIVLSKWLMLDMDIIIFDEPTKGIDVGTKVEIYNLIRQLAMRGKSIIVISSELQELMALADRIIVINKGRIVTEVDPDKETEQSILFHAI